ncbi:uncharacterized protein EDB91DRAFT_1084695 [Suillus paluster]|uniref:uncharacterized protein n=1 Tax=Suillus paluster TaxID=48578 RepID=UPI001B86A060|nr:uncharacterized protein EDB91DRAFT_1084695 [Suillus paluster]KAG1732661.1 hypothetical protein EDB91DRAFT_1084695 [Suillus paluster]
MALLIDTDIKDPPSANIFLTPIMAAFRLLFSLSSTSRGFAANAGGFGLKKIRGFAANAGNSHTNFSTIQRHTMTVIRNLHHDRKKKKRKFTQQKHGPGHTQSI